MDKDQVSKHDELLARISALIKENKAFEDQLHKLSTSYEELLVENEKLKFQLAQGTKEGESGARQDSLKFKMATVLFANIDGFANLTDTEQSKQLMDQLDEVFMQFDKITEKYKIEKIKTIGDTYMCAGGVPVKNSTNPLDVVLAALEMQTFLDKLGEKYKTENKMFWGMRIGIHTGPVTATMQGKKKVSYDIKGETVNIASRMEAASQSGKINISVMTYELVKEYFTCEYNGKMPVKYKGDLEMYFIRRIKKAFSENRDGLTPNEVYRTRYCLRQFADLQEIVLDKLERELPTFLYYHNYKHTIDVATQAELIGWGEGVTDEEILLLKTAALFHDTGQIYGSKDHELKSTLIAKEFLPRFGYSEKQIEEICDIIMATKLPPNPQNRLHKIICDSDLDYLGRSDFIPVSNMLYKELHEQGLMNSLNDWNKIQVKFLSSHQFFTNTAKSLREVNKQDQIERIAKLITED